jgi:tetratricopeptide (TPR) repeat protein
MKDMKLKAKGLIQKQDYDTALALLLPLFSRGKDAETVYLIGKCFDEKLDISNAVRFFQRALEYEPMNHDFLFAMGKAYQEFDQPDEALNVYRRIVAKKCLK